jgi:putative DNA primase/helicase
MLPEKVRPWVKDVCERMQCPPDYVGVSVMGALGSVIGRRVTVRPQRADDWSVVANQWPLCIGRPGVMKSPAMEEALLPVKTLAAAAREQFNLAKAEHDMKLAAAKARSKNADKEAAKILAKNKSADVSYLFESENIEEPTLKRYVTTNVSVEALGVLLQQNPNGLLVHRDEMLSLLDRLDEEGHADERGLYLTGWNGNSAYTFDRIGRGLDLHVDAVCLSMLGGTQPGRISQYLVQVRRGGRGDDGLIQRFGLMVWPDIPASWTNVDRKPDRQARDAAFRAFQTLDGLDWRVIGAKRDFGSTGDEEGVPYLRLSMEANERFVAWRTQLERRLRLDGMHPALESHLAKYRKLVPGLALIGHLTNDGTGEVSDAAVEKALKWATYLETHAARTYASTTIASADAARAIVAKIRSGHLKEQFGSREVWRPQWSLLTDRDTVHAALQLLVDYDWLGVKTVTTGGRSATVYTVNPKVLAP